jgi:hypothetical protein
MNWVAAVGVVIDILPSGKDDTEFKKLAQDILGKLDELRRGQDRIVHEMRFLFEESKKFQIELYLQSMNNEMEGFLKALKGRIEEIPIFQSPQGKEESRQGFLAPRNEADPVIYKITSTGPAAFQGMVIGYGAPRAIFDALQRTAPDRQVRLEYRKAEATALKNFSDELAVFTAPAGKDSIPFRLVQDALSISAKTNEVDGISKHPSTSNITETFPATRGREHCTRTVIYDRVWNITGSIKDGWTDTDQLIVHKDEIGGCEPPDEPPPGHEHGGRDRWLTAGDHVRLILGEPGAWS